MFRSDSYVLEVVVHFLDQVLQILRLRRSEQQTLVSSDITTLRNFLKRFLLEIEGTLRRNNLVQSLNREFIARLHYHSLVNHYEAAVVLLITYRVVCDLGLLQRKEVLRTH